MPLTRILSSRLVYSIKTMVQALDSRRMDLVRLSKCCEEIYQRLLISIEVYGHI